MKERWFIMKQVVLRLLDERVVVYLMFIVFVYDIKFICMEFDRVLVYQMYRVLLLYVEV